MRTEKQVLERFISMINSDKETGCWNWLGVTSDGYGDFGFNNNYQKAHRFSYAYFRGEFPKDLSIDHKCRNRKCVNPDHLTPMPIRENVLLGFGLPAINARKTHCLRGHEFSKENTRITKEGGRVCKKCKNDYQRSWDKASRKKVVFKKYL